MRLINTATLQLEEFFEAEVPRYAILSHTWEKEEVTFQHFTSLPRPEHMAGYSKIKETCRLAREQGIGYAWVDTCCIDKSSSAELTESINSMFRWYENSAICYVYLSDFAPGTSVEESLPHCRWFTRGWTLQELVAPRTISFFDRAWNHLGDGSQYIDLIRDITGIKEDVLLKKATMHSLSVAERMSWASGRTTTRSEDTAYCLLGLFDVNMPLIYGEGTKAFRRLQEEIVKQSNDLTIFAWEDPSPLPPPPSPKEAYLSAGDFRLVAREQAMGRNDVVWLGSHPVECVDVQYGDLLAPSPAFFKYSGNISRYSRSSFNPDVAVTNKGLRIDTPLYTVAARGRIKHAQYILPVGIRTTPDDICAIGVVVDKVGPSLLIRNHSSLRSYVRQEGVAYVLPQTYHILLAPRDLGTRVWAGGVYFPPGTELSVRECSPSGNWDLTRRLFHEPRASEVASIAKCVVAINGCEVWLWILLIMGPDPIAKIYSRDDNWLPRWIFRTAHVREGVRWSDLTLESDALGLHANRTLATVGGEQYSISVSLDRLSGSRNEGQRHALRLQVEGWRNEGDKERDQGLE